MHPSDPPLEKDTAPLVIAGQRAAARHRVRPGVQRPPVRPQRRPEERRPEEDRGRRRSRLRLLSLAGVHQNR